MRNYLTKESVYIVCLNATIDCHLGDFDFTCHVFMETLNNNLLLIYPVDFTSVKRLFAK